MNKNLIIAGVHKAGTSALYKYLRKHPKIYASLKKETDFFTPINYGHPIKPIEQYEAYFSEAKKEQYCLDASPSYMYGKEKTVQVLKEKLVNPKIIILLRNPVSRFFSFYHIVRLIRRETNNNNSENYEVFFNQTFNAFKKYEESGYVENSAENRTFREGCYSLYLEFWLKEFGKDLKLIFFEDFFANPHYYMKEICEWLEIENIYVDYKFEKENARIEPKNLLFHRLVFKIFFKYEKIWRRSPMLNKTLSKLYRKLNNKKQKIKNVGEESIKNKVIDAYRPYNQKLKEIGEKYGFKVPDSYQI